MHLMLVPFFTVQLLHKLSIRATNGSEKLFKVVKNPVTDHLPSDCRKIGSSSTVWEDYTYTYIIVFSEHAKTCVDVLDFVPTLPAGILINSASAFASLSLL